MVSFLLGIENFFIGLGIFRNAVVTQMLQKAMQFVFLLHKVT